MEGLHRLSASRRSANPGNASGRRGGATPNRGAGAWRGDAPSRFVPGSRVVRAWLGGTGPGTKAPRHHQRRAGRGTGDIDRTTRAPRRRCLEGGRRQQRSGRARPIRVDPRRSVRAARVDAKRWRRHARSPASRVRRRTTLAALHSRVVAFTHRRRLFLLCATRVTGDPAGVWRAVPSGRKATPLRRSAPIRAASSMRIAGGDDARTSTSRAHRSGACWVAVLGDRQTGRAGPRAG